MKAKMSLESCLAPLKIAKVYSGFIPLLERLGVGCVSLVPESYLPRKPCHNPIPTHSKSPSKVENL
jgi:hypothetical protein